MSREIKEIREKMSLLINDKNMKLTAKEVVNLSKKLDKLVVRQMKELNGLNKQLTLFSEYNEIYLSQ